MNGRSLTCEAGVVLRAAACARSCNAAVEKTSAEQEFDRLMAELRDERAEAMKAAGAVYEKAAKAAIEDRKKAVQAADAAYVEKHDKIIKRLTSKEKAAA